MSLNNIELKALRRNAGLEVSESVELLGKAKRTIQSLEKGERNLLDDTAEKALSYSLTYSNVYNLVERHVNEWHERNPILQTDNTEEYAQWVKTRPRLSMPYLVDFEAFKLKSNMSDVLIWRVYQSVIGHFYALGKIDNLNDDLPFPSFLSCLSV